MERNETKHTPGPWTTGDGDRESVLSTVNWHCVAQANNALPEMEANARLIAAAPMLLAQHEWNKRVRDSVDALLAEAGYAAGSSARHQLSQMNFDAIALATSANLKEPQQ